ncbi:hypothetical protein CAEBREN_08971 [Caenorhabditis brenneri]|uniref:EGF-like domain-containing protein n=1 Tax=Caenorhabditis brenneri TaxID=135651 RepID=G0MTN5_CAEBE|nr:hypothetical protein CAEBREN_08971 [Caenorhabditis brenneri]
MYCLQFLLLSLILFLSFARALDDSLDDTILNDVHRILQKRSALDNVALDDPRAKCRNGGIYAGGICHCIRGQTGDHCEHFECGMSFVELRSVFDSIPKVSYSIHLVYVNQDGKGKCVIISQQRNVETKGNGRKIVANVLVTILEVNVNTRVNVLKAS